MSETAVVNVITPLYKKWLKNRKLELEIVLGRRDEQKDKWVTGVDFEYFNRLIDTFQSNPNWSQVIPRTPFACTFFDDDVRGTYNPKEGTAVFVTKTRIDRVEVKSIDRPYSFRVNLKREDPVPYYVAKTIPAYYRLLERFSWIHGNGVRYDLSKVACGKTKEEACANYHFEVEIELLHNTAYIGNRTAHQLSISILEKTKDLLGRFDCDNKPVPFKFSVIK